MAKQVVVIGAGIVGICTSLSLLERGFEVKLIDRDLPVEGASHGNAGVISPWSCVPQSLPGLWQNVPKWLIDPEGPVSIRLGYLPKFLPWSLKFLQAGKMSGLTAIGDAMNVLSQSNMDLYRQHLKGTKQQHLICDSLYVHVSRNTNNVDLKEIGWQMREQRGVPLQIIDENELHELEPELSPEYKAAVVIESQARTLDPKKMGKALFEKAISLGATFNQTTVSHISQAKNTSWVVHAQDRNFNCDKLVIAAGAWPSVLLQPLRLKLPLEAERGYHLNFKNPGISINNSIMDTERKFVISSMLNGVRCAGTAEFSGLDYPPDYRRARIFKPLVKKLFPNINIDDTEEWMGTRPSFPDSLPCIGTIEGYENLYSAFGHSHYGFGMAPNTGRIVASIISGETPKVDLRPYRTRRFE